MTSNADLNGRVQPPPLDPRAHIAALVLSERRHHDAIGAVADLPLGTGGPAMDAAAAAAHERCDEAADAGELTWRDVAMGDFFAAMREDAPTAYAAMAIQAMATLMASIEELLDADPALSLPPPF